MIPGNFTIEGSQETVTVDKGKEDSVTIQSKDPIQMVVGKGTKEEFEPSLTLDEEQLNEDGELTAPVEEGDVVGKLGIALGEDDLGFLNESMASSLQVDVVANETVNKANWFILSMRAVEEFFGNLWETTTSTVKGWY